MATLTLAGSAIADAGRRERPGRRRLVAGLRGHHVSLIAEATLNSTILRELLPDFTEKTGINVELEEAPYDSLVQKVTLDASTSQGQYDVVSLPYEFLGAFAENGWLAPLDDRLADTASLPRASIRRPSSPRSRPRPRCGPARPTACPPTAP